MNLQSILFPNSEICDVEELYFHRDGDYLLLDGFFNLFYLEKHHKYCDIEELTLVLEVKGFKKLVVMHDSSEIHTEILESRPVSGRERIRAFKEGREVDSGDRASELRKVRVDIPYKLCKKGVIWFKLQIDPRFIEGDSWILRGCYDGTGSFVQDSDHAKKIDSKGEGTDGGGISGDENRITIGVNICTYRREAYVIRNMRSLLRAAGSEGAEEAFRHLHVFIIDNGQTLSDNEEFQAVLDSAERIMETDPDTNADSDCQGEHRTDRFIEVIPNVNTGGTGGFSRGMVEAIDRQEELGLTHLLMMDDDAVFDPELFVRLYGFLSFLKKEYRDITVAGALMREDFPYIQHAAGEWYGQMKLHNEYMMADLRDYVTCTSDWMTTCEYPDTTYGAWWCCCYHMSAVTEDKLPLPLFVHHDDIQFGLINSDKGIVFLNGINVWHQGFELVFPGVKQYYNMRNNIISSYLFEKDYLKRHLKAWTIRRYIGMLISYRYADCDFIYRGLTDFLRGKEWLLNSNPEAIHKELMVHYSEVCPFSKDVAGEISAYYVPDEVTIEMLREYYDHSRYETSIFKKISFNGWFLPGDKKMEVITPLDSPWKTYRHKRVMLYEPGSGKGCVMSRSNADFFKGLWRIVRMSFDIDMWKIKGAKW